MSSEHCTVPPPGWHCTRAIGHNGPCAAVPVNPAPDDTLKDRDESRAENAKLRETLRATIETARQGEAIRKAEIEKLKADLEAQLAEVAEGDRIIADQGDKLRELRVAIANLKAGEAIRTGQLAEARALLDKVRKHPSMTVFGDIDAFLAPSSEADTGGAPMIRDSLTGQLHRAPTLADMGEVDLAPECPPGGYGLLATVNARLVALEKAHASLETHQGIDRFEAQSNANNIASHCRRLEAGIDHVADAHKDGECTGGWCHCDLWRPEQPEAAEAGHVFDDGGSKWERFCWHFSGRGNRCAKGPGAPIHAKPCTRCNNNGGNGVPCPNCGRTG